MCTGATARYPSLPASTTLSTNTDILQYDSVAAGEALLAPTPAGTTFAVLAAYNLSLERPVGRSGTWALDVQLGASFLQGGSLGVLVVPASLALANLADCQTVRSSVVVAVPSPAHGEGSSALHR